MKAKTTRRNREVSSINTKNVHDLAKILNELFPAKLFKNIKLDVYHALEHLSDCGKVLYGAETREFETWQEETTLELLWNGFKGIKQRLDRLDAEKRTDSEKEAMRILRGYLTNHSERLNHRKRLAEGKSIGSGQVEGACKNLIGKRLKQTGARWRVRRVNNMATLCAVM